MFLHKKIEGSATLSTHQRFKHNTQNRETTILSNVVGLDEIKFPLMS